MLHLRPYRKADFQSISSWLSDPQDHAFWCGDIFPYPLARKDFEQKLAADEVQYGSCGYTAIREDGTPVGFAVLSFNEVEHTGMICYLIVDAQLRHQGHGTEMLRLLCKYSRLILGINQLTLNVFDSNVKAINCYQKCGFKIIQVEDAPVFIRNKKYYRCRMQRCEQNL